MLKLELVNVVKRFGKEGEAVIRGLSTIVAEGQMLVLLGPSGCGKTTALQLVAGLLHPDDGSIIIDGKAVAGPGWGLPPERRNLGMVFQSYAVWPHRTVFENVAYGLELRSVPRDELRRKVQQALELVHLGELGERYPSEISGGQQQRVALARAIVVEPSLLLLDEPLSNLDATLREQMRIELKLLQRKLGLASIYVTHDQAEAMVLADHLVVMRDGIIEQQGPAEAVFLRPRSGFIARFLGVTNLLKGRLIEMAPNRARVEIGALGDTLGFRRRRCSNTADARRYCLRFDPPSRADVIGFPADVGDQRFRGTDSGENLPGRPDGVSCSVRRNPLANPRRLFDSLRSRRHCLDQFCP